ncbi:MAG: type 4a pilus biogenesis protein PilO [Pyrinomonadaceae bacterium]
MAFQNFKFQEKPWKHQLAIIAAVGLLLYLIVWYFVIWSYSDRALQTRSEVSKLQEENNRALIASQRLPEFRASFTRAEADYEELKALLPEQRELTVVLQGLQDRALDKLLVRRFSPKDDFQQEFYSGKPIEVEVVGSYNNLGAFFAQMAAYQRIVSITDFSIRQSPNQAVGRTIEAAVSLNRLLRFA